MPNENTTEHTIQSGETLSRIAAQNGLGLTELLAANPQITNPDHIVSGQVIFIPGKHALGGGPVEGGTEDAAPPTPAAGILLRGLDANVNLTTKGSCLKSHGFAFAIRYYNINNPAKNLTGPEAHALVTAGLQLGAVFEDGHPDHDAFFDHGKGVIHGKAAHDMANNKIGQPGGSAIYFAVDYDPALHTVQTVIADYFKGVREGLATGNGGTPKYAIGVYGSGLTCRLLLAEGLATFTWLTQSTGFTESKDFAKKKLYNLIQFLDTNVCGINVDPDETNPAKPSGLFTI
jgi:LysM repeat protein